MSEWKPSAMSLTINGYQRTSKPLFQLGSPLIHFFSLYVKSGVINLPSDYPLDEMLLKFIARFPSGRQSAYLRGDVLRHFIGLDPDKPISHPSPGSIPYDE
jgi:hypothetical protein